MAAGTEIERKFLVTDERWRDHTDASCSTIQQGYVVADGEREVRVRLRDGKGVLTVKRGGPRMVREEIEVDLDPTVARKLLDHACVGRMIQKNRHRIPATTPNGAARPIEVDVFRGEFEGLVLAEVEVPAQDAELPDVDWLGEEVTGDRAYYGGVLARADAGPPEVGDLGPAGQ